MMWCMAVLPSLESLLLTLISNSDLSNSFMTPNRLFLAANNSGEEPLLVSTSGGRLNGS